jgi:recombination protein RecR
VVENVQDVMSIENTGQYNGLYHVLGGIISPMDGVGPSDIEIDSLIKRIEQGEIQEVILALPTTMEGDTTNFYIYKRLQNLSTTPPKISQIARGVAIGNDIEYTDEITLGRSIVNRIEFKI